MQLESILNMHGLRPATGDWWRRSQLDGCRSGRRLDGGAVVWRKEARGVERVGVVFAPLRMIDEVDDRSRSCAVQLGERRRCLNSIRHLYSIYGCTSVDKRSRQHGHVQYSSILTSCCRHGSKKQFFFITSVN